VKRFVERVRNPGCRRPRPTNESEQVKPNRPIDDSGVLPHDAESTVRDPYSKRRFLGTRPCSNPVHEYRWSATVLRVAGPVAAVSSGEWRGREAEAVPWGESGLLRLVLQTQPRSNTVLQYA
jgi:hypothetical protein